jgi:pimeloyl-ACP methyl ester carboxylesterase
MREFSQSMSSNSTGRNSRHPSKPLIGTSCVPQAITVKRIGATPPFHGPNGDPVPGSIAEINYLRLGGLDQWVMIRGETVTNPILVLLHGGPGFPEMRLFRHFNASLEKSFTIVYWDQRGTNRSFDRNIPRASMTLEQFIADLDELIDTLRTRFAKDKVVIYGHSWGSALGVCYASRFPEKVAAYAGAGQVGNWPASERASYAFALGEATRRHHHKALKELRAIGPPPYAARAKMVQGKWLGRFLGFVRGMPLWKFVRIVLGGPEASILDVLNIMRGMQFSQDTMWADVSVLDLTTAVPTLRVPVFFFLGRYDHVIAADTSADYFQVLTAPAKRLVWFEESAHEPPFEEPAKFNRAMVELVRPWVVGSAL